MNIIWKWTTWQKAYMKRMSPMLHRGVLYQSTKTIYRYTAYRPWGRLSIGIPDFAWRQNVWLCSIHDATLSKAWLFQRWELWYCLQAQLKICEVHTDIVSQINKTSVSLRTDTVWYIFSLGWGRRRYKIIPLALCPSICNGTIDWTRGCSCCCPRNCILNLILFSNLDATWRWQPDWQYPRQWMPVVIQTLQWQAAASGQILRRYAELWGLQAHHFLGTWVHCIHGHIFPAHSPP